MSRIINPPVLIIAASTMAAVYSDAVPPIIRALVATAWATVAFVEGSRRR